MPDPKRLHVSNKYLFSFFLIVSITLTAICTAGFLVLFSKPVWTIDQFNNAPSTKTKIITEADQITQTITKTASAPSQILFKTQDHQEVTIQIKVLSGLSEITAFEKKVKSISLSNLSLIKNQIDPGDLEGHWLVIPLPNVSSSAKNALSFQIKPADGQQLALAYEGDGAKYPIGQLTINNNRVVGNLGFITLTRTGWIDSVKYQLLTLNQLRIVILMMAVIVALFIVIAFLKNKKTYGYYLLLLLLAIIYTLPLYQNMTNWGSGDWQEAASYYASIRHSLAAWQFPEWNPYLCGGTPLWADPLGYTPSLGLLFSLLVGPIVGTKIATTIAVWLGLSGFFTLARFFQYSRTSSLLIAMISMLNGFFFSHLMTGHLLWLSWGWMPWIIFFFLLSIKRPFYVFMAAVLSVWLLFAGPVYFFAYLIIIVPIIALGYGWKNNCLRKTILSLTIFALLVAGLGAIKALPMINYLSDMQGSLPAIPGIPYDNVLNSFLSRTVTDKDNLDIDRGIIWNEYSGYIGLMSLLLVAIGFLFLITKKRCSPVFYASLILFIIFGSVAFSQSSKWNVFEYFPILRELHYRSRAIGITLVLMAFSAGTVTDLLQKKYRKKRTGQLIAFIVTIFVFIELSFAATPNLLKLFNIPQKVFISQKSFNQVSANYNNGLHIAEAGYGAVDFCPPHARLWRPNASITDKNQFIEITDENSSNIYLKKFTPNKIDIQIDNIQKPADVTLNQKFASGWTSREVSVKETANGLIGFKVSPNIDSKTIQLKYRTPLLLIGASISFTTLLLSIIYIIFSRRDFKKKSF